MQRSLILYAIIGHTSRQAWKSRPSVRQSRSIVTAVRHPPLAICIVFTREAGRSLGKRRAKTLATDTGRWKRRKVAVLPAGSGIGRRDLEIVALIWRRNRLCRWNTRVCSARLALIVWLWWEVKWKILHRYGVCGLHVGRQIQREADCSRSYGATAVGWW